MRSIRRKKPSKFSRKLKKQLPNIYQIFNFLDRSIKKIGEILIVFNLDGINHIVAQNRHIVERYFNHILDPNNFKNIFKKIFSEYYGYSLFYHLVLVLFLCVIINGLDLKQIQQ